jgi:hypothetical protein
MARQLRKLAHIFLSELLSNDVGFFLLGLVNRIFLRGRINTVFLYYPVNKRYLRSVTFDWYAVRFRWRPIFVGVFFHRGSGGIICAVSADEGDFLDPENAPKLRQVHDRLKRIASYVGAQTVSYAGILPSVLEKRGIHRDAVEAGRTVHWVLEAVDLVIKEAGLGPEAPIIVLGAAGFVGKRVVQRLRASSRRPIVEIDPAHPDTNCRGADALWELHGAPALLLNVSRNRVIAEYADRLWGGLVILNEVYPEADAHTLDHLRQKSVRYFHLQGVDGFAIPRFPQAYSGAIPCCAASAIEATEAEKMNFYSVMLLEK